MMKDLINFEVKAELNFIFKFKVQAKWIIQTDFYLS